MARANRHHIPGQVWHITHRCHKQEFLLKFARGRKRWLQWLFEAKNGDTEVLPKSLQLAAGKTAQEYNRRKNRKGAYWEDRYHATAIETGEHFFRCLIYIDLNMVRNGVVPHPSSWAHGGYNEIQNPPLRYSLIDREQPIACCGLRSDEQLRKAHRKWVEESIHHNRLNIREPEWTDAIAVGSERFVNKIREKLQLGLRGRKTRETSGHYELREQEAVYNAHFDPENVRLSTENAYYWDLTTE